VIVVVDGDLGFSEGGRRDSWFVVCGKMGENDGVTGRDLNKSRGSWVSRVRTIAHCWAIVRPQGSVRVRVRAAAGDERSSTGAWRVSERSPKEVRSFASSVSAALFRALRRTIAPGGAIVRFISVFSTFWRTYANDRSLMGERSLPQCAKCHSAQVKLKKQKI
jgi:hypothetical protein